MSKNYIAHKFRLKPRQEQISVLVSWSHTIRFTWNHFLSLTCGDTSIGDSGIHESRYVSAKQEKFETSISNIAFGQEADSSVVHGLRSKR